jgi:Holliday junction resolvasome RuvABC endonuclease subunit
MIRYYSGLASGLMSGVGYLISDYLGIDPGLNGGFAVVSGDKIRYKMAMPTLSFKTVDGKTKTEIDREGVLSFLSTIPPLTHVAIEEVHAFRKQNITATCTTCRNYGILLMAFTVAHMRITEVPSDTWQKHFGIFPAKEAGGKSTKEQAFDIVRMIYPDDDFRKSERAQKPHDGMVDACLIAEYCQSLFVPTHDVIESQEVNPIPDVAGTIKPLELQTWRQLTRNKRRG